MTTPHTPIKVLHVTPHLGGGVGKALLTLAEAAKAGDCDVDNSFLLLDRPEKTQFVDAILGLGCPVDIVPGEEEIHDLLARADIVQLEWWNHPATFKFLCDRDLPALRLIVWCHVSGAYNPVIPPELIKAAERFLFTSTCSYQTRTVRDLGTGFKNKSGVVSSAGGFGQLPQRHPDPSEPLRAGYIGSLNFSKLNPRYVEFLAAVTVPHFQVRLIGDVLNRELLLDQCKHYGKPHLLDFRGYTTNIVEELSSINVLAYLLNPRHYGTAEIALLEAMAMGVVPVVLDNPAEEAIVENDVTGLVVHSPGEFAKAIDWLTANPEERVRIGAGAARFVRETFTAKRMSDLLNGHYRKIMVSGKRAIDFKSIFGGEPADWFLSCQATPGRFSTDTDLKASVANVWDYSLNEKTKGSVFHFLRHFPDDIRLVNWAQSVERLQ